MGPVNRTDPPCPLRFSKVGKSLRKALRRVVVGARTVFAPPRGQFAAVLGPEVEQAEVRSADPVVLSNLDSLFFLGVVLVPVVLHQSEHRVVGEA